MTVLRPKMHCRGTLRAREQSSTVPSDWRLSVYMNSKEI